MTELEEEPPRSDSPLERILHERIARDGPMPFGAFMQLALYHPRHGYYSAGRERSGWRGHFLTSPELSPLFGALWARGFEKVWRACGSPSEFTVVEVGPGEGGFAAAVLAAAPAAFARCLRYRLVERVPALQERQRMLLAGRDVAWSPSVTEVPPAAHGVVFANEVLDNLPVHVVERRDGALLELCVDSARGRLVETLRPPAGNELAAWLQRAGAEVPEGHRFEVTMAAESFVRRCAAAFGTGALVLVDYGAESRELAERPRGTLVAYSSSGASQDVLARPGRQDVTAHANWTVVRRTCEAAGLHVTGPVAQRDVLLALGAREMGEDLRGEHARASAEGRGADAVRALSGRSSLGAVLDPGGLGGLGVLVATRGIPPDTLP
ncbi:MAG: SAM-dependent methyltransferase [Actinomycetota bacterium]|nr:SAM-dependent methyltransferase [Actinomycetota bacterium]